MADIHSVLGVPITTEQQMKMWGSKHVCNHTKAIIAFSNNMKEANDNLRRYGYTRGWRLKSLYHYGKYVNKPDLASVPFTEITTPWWKELYFVKDITIDDCINGHIAP